MPRIDPTNVQGLVFQLYRYPLSRHLLFRISDAAAGRAFLRGLLPQVTHAATNLSVCPDPLLNIGVTWNGLSVLGAIGSVGTAASAEISFPLEFRNRPPSPLSGDWNGRIAGVDVHLTVHLHCMTEAGLLEATRRVRGVAKGVTELLPAADGDQSITGRALGGAKLHFGFQDGISQPRVNWDDVPDRPDLIDFRHFVLGYSTPQVSSLPSDGEWADFVRDGSYAAFQLIHQNVAAFEAFLTRNAPTLAPELPLAEARELLAAKMMGRWRDGTPMALSPAAPNPALADASQFGYKDDPSGARCPLTAHVRIANRRDEPLTPVVEANFSDGGPHLMRRGMAYGPELRGETDDGVDRGLVGMFLCSNLRTQFQTVINWINKADFSPVFNTDRLRWQDMMMGDRSVPGAVAKCAIAMPHGEVLLDALPQFIRIQGTLFLLLPGLKGLALMAQEPA
jgi:Dyp-type peroxidase family